MSIRLNGSTSGYLELDAPAAAGNNTIRFPGGNGSARQSLRNSSTPGELEWGLTQPATNGVARQSLVGDGSGGIDFQWDAGSFFWRQPSNLPGDNVNTAQPVFGTKNLGVVFSSGVVLASSTVYAFEALYLLSKTTGGTSHSIGLSFGGTATINDIAHGGSVAFGAVAFPLRDSSTANYGSAQASNAQVSAAIAAATASAAISLRGTVSINAGGTFIPQYTLSAAPGGAYSTLTGSWIRFVPITSQIQGTWI